MVENRYKPQRFIILDDDESNNHLCTFIIQQVSRNAEVVNFVNPLNALVYFRDNYQGNDNYPQTVLLLDIKMPQISGWEFLNRLALLSISDLSKIQIYILSSSESESDKELAFENEMIKSYVQKPLTAGVVKNIMTGLL